MKRGSAVWMLVIVATLVTLFFSSTVFAARYSSSSYLIDASVDNSFGGQNSSTNYRMTTAGGENITGTGSSASYKIGMGYTAQLIKAIQVDVAQTSVSFPALTAGTPQTAQIDVQTRTDAPGYTLAVMQSGNLSDGGGNTIAPVSGTIASPVAWSNGTTKGLGFTIISAYGGIPAIWNAGNSYAGFPMTSTSFFTRNGMFSGIDTTSIRLKLDTAFMQVAGNYSNTITFTGTIIP